MTTPTNGAETTNTPSFAEVWATMWVNMGGLPEDEPTADTVGDWLKEGECPPEPMAEANHQLTELLGLTTRAPYIEASEKPPDGWEINIDPIQPDPIAETVRVIGITGDGQLLFTFPDLPDAFPLENVPEDLSISSFLSTDIAYLAQRWAALAETDRPIFAVSTLLRAWKDRPPHHTPERRPTQILADSLRYARPAQGILPLKGLDVPCLGQQPGRQAALPGLEQPPGAVVPVLPLQVAEFSKAGQGAPITPRLWFGFQMALPQEMRNGRDVRMNFTLEEIVSWLWPNGWRRKRDLPKLAQGLHDLNHLGIVYERVKWLLVRPVKLPTWETRLNDELRVDVTSLPGSDRGPMIDTVRLWQLGVKAGAPWRAWIRLAYLWDNAKMLNGGYRIYATRPEVLRASDGTILDASSKPVHTPDGRPVTDWNHPSAVRTGNIERNPQADRIPILDNRDLAHLGFDDSDVPRGTLRERASETRRWLREMERLGAVVLEWHGDKVRVLQPWFTKEPEESPCDKVRVLEPSLTKEQEDSPCVGRRENVPRGQLNYRIWTVENRPTRRFS